MHPGGRVNCTCGCRWVRVRSGSNSAAVSVEKSPRLSAPYQVAPGPRKVRGLDIASQVALSHGQSPLQARAAILHAAPFLNGTTLPPAVMASSVSAQCCISRR